MSFINYSSREINGKIVYYGPGLCGKTTNLQYIYNKTNPEARGKMISLATETERTLFFDFLPLSLGEIRGFKTRFHLYTVPGQVFYDASRKLILKGVDGVCFVAGSPAGRREPNVGRIDAALRARVGDRAADGRRGVARRSRALGGRRGGLRGVGARSRGVREAARGSRVLRRAGAGADDRASWTRGRSASVIHWCGG